MRPTPAELKARRIERGIKLEAVADHLAIDPSVLAAVENGSLSMTPEYIDAWVRVLDSNPKRTSRLQLAYPERRRLNRVVFLAAGLWGFLLGLSSGFMAGLFAAQTWPWGR